MSKRERAAARPGRTAWAERLESRRLLSAGHAIPAHIPVNVVGSYVGTAHVHFSPASFHAPALDSVSLVLDNETPTGAVSGTLTDQFGGARLVSGMLRRRSIALRVGSGRIMVRLGSDGLVLLGTLDLSGSPGAHAVRWRGRVELERVPGAAGLFSRYVGVAKGLYVPDAVSPTGKPVRTVHIVSLTITSQSSDGSFTGDIEGLPYHGPVVGSVSGVKVAIHYAPQSGITDPFDSSISGTLTPDHRAFRGGYDNEFELDLMYEMGTLMLRAENTGTQLV